MKSVSFQPTLPRHEGKTELLLVEYGNHVAHNRFYKYRGRSADWMARQLFN
jgi:hypothetical protein